MEIEYDMEKEKRNLKKKTDKILKKYPNIDGLEEVLNKMLTLVDSKPFNTLTKNLVNYLKKAIEIYPKNKVNIVYLLEEFSISRYSLVLDMDKDNSRSIFSRRSDKITYTKFTNFVDFNLGILTMKEKDKPLYSRERMYYLTNKVMVLLDDFDKDIPFNSADEDFFRSLDAVEWNKNAKKLCKKMIFIQLDIADLVITTLFSDILHDVFANYRSVPIVLATCSAIKNNRAIIDYEDVVCAFKTFYKLFDADINDLI